MNRPVRSKISLGVAMGAVLLWTACGVWAQQPVPGAAAAANAGSDILRIRKMTPVKEKTPVFRTAAPGQASSSLARSASGRPAGAGTRHRSTPPASRRSRAIAGPCRGAPARWEDIDRRRGAAGRSGRA